MLNTITTTLISAITGTALWEGFKFIFPEIQKVIKDRRDARKIINENIDPLLKSVDELLAKIYGYARSDFKDFEILYKNQDMQSKSEILYTLYIFSAFFARLAIIRKESSFINLSSFKKGRHFLSFMYAFEYRKNTFISKSVQRSIGDCLIYKDNNKYEVLSIQEFREKIINGAPIFMESVKSLEDALLKSNDKLLRQRIYLFGIILQSFIDYFDSKHLIVRKRDIYLNKLSSKTRNDIRFRVFGEYLPFINEPFEYYKRS